MTVWFMNPVKDDISTASKWGEVKYVNPHYVYGDELTDDGKLPEAALTNIHQAADNFDPDRDYMALAGDHVQMVAFAALLGGMYTDFKVLRWDKFAGYIPVTIVVDEE